MEQSTDEAPVFAAGNDESLNHSSNNTEASAVQQQRTVTESVIFESGPGCTLPRLAQLLASSTMLEAELSVHTTAPDGSAAVNNESNGDRQNSQLAFADLYDKEQCLRSGSYGTVYTCRHKHKPDITYAVKIMDRHKLKPKDVENVFREVGILHEISSSLANHNDNSTLLHVIQLIDFFIDPSSLYMVQVYAAGGDVFDRLTSRNQYTERDARDLALNLIQTIHFLHSNKTCGGPIVHRDLKPENLLLVDHQNDSQILVADFGFARHLATDDFCHTRCGTPAYVSPEVVLGIPYSIPVDMWSIGCVLYMLIAGYPPFQAENHRALFRKIRAGDYIFHDQFWKNVSVEAKQLITHLLTVNVKTRWTVDQALQCDWFTKASAAQLEKHDLIDSIEQLKKFDAKSAWKRAVTALGFCSTAAFWKTDAISFAQQLAAWDQSVDAANAVASSKSGPVGTSTSQPSSGLMGKLPRIKFANVYEMKRHIRKGKYASVWECEHKPTGATHAVKIIQRAGLQPKDDEAVLNEVAMMQSLSGSTYVIQLLDFYEEEDCFYLVMEYCVGGDVFDRIVHYKHYTESDARALAYILLKAVRSIHKTGIAHRDIKPQNLLLLSSDDNALIRVADFGFARRVHTPESLTSRVGTPTYVAPEILKNIPHDQRVDLWSVGVVIFVLLVGYPPFMDENQSTLFQKIRNGECEYVEHDWKRISPEAKTLVQGLLTVDPNDRWTIDQCLQSPWIRADPTKLSHVDLSESVRVLREKKNRLRAIARAFMGFGDHIKPVEVATQIQSGDSEILSKSKEIV